MSEQESEVGYLALSDYECADAFQAVLGQFIRASERKGSVVAQTVFETDWGAMQIDVSDGQVVLKFSDAIYQALRDFPEPIPTPNPSEHDGI